MQKRLGTNVAAGAISSLVSILAAVVATPIYLRLLGAEAFGVYGFFLSLQAALLALDGGLAVSATRAVAQGQAGPSQRATADLMCGLARASWYVALAIALLLAALASYLADSWLNLSDLPKPYVAQSLAIAGIAIAGRWPLALYQAILTGRQQLVRLSGLNVLMTLVSTGGAVLLLLALDADLRVLFGWLAAATFVQVAWCRRLAARALGGGSAPPRGTVRQFFRAGAAAGWLGVVGLLLMQVDKAVLSRMLPADQFGYYVMASMMAGALYALVMPVFNALYPRFSILGHAQDRADLRRLYRDSSLALATLLFPLAAVLSSFGDSILLLWTGDPVASQAASPILMMLAVGSAIHGIMFLPYALKLACGASRLALWIGVILLAASLPVTILAAARWSGAGAAAAWLMLNVFYLIAGSIVTHRRLLPGVTSSWLLRDVAPPALLSLGSAHLLAEWTRAQGWSAGPRTIAASMLVVSCWALLVCASSRLRLGARPMTAKAAGTK